MRLRRIIPRFSLRTLVIFLLLVTSGVGLWWHWEPWTRLAALAGTNTNWGGPAFSDDGSRVLVYTWYGPVRVFDSRNGALLFGLGTTDLATPGDGSHYATLTPDGKRVIVVLDWRAFSVENSEVVSGSMETRIYDIETGALIRTMAAAIPFSSGRSRWLISTRPSEDGTTGIFNTEALAKHRLRGPPILGPAYIPRNGAVLVSTHQNTARTSSAEDPRHRCQTALVRNLPEGDAVSSLNCPEDDDCIFSVKVSPDGKLAVTISGDLEARTDDGARPFRSPREVPAPRTAIIWDTSNGRALARLAVDRDAYSQHYFAADDRLLLTHALPLRVWEAGRGEWTLDAPAGVGKKTARLVDGSRFIVRNGRHLEIREISTGKLLAAVPGHFGMRCDPLSPDGRALVSMEYDEGGFAEIPCHPVLWRRRRPEMSPMALR